MAFRNAGKAIGITPTEIYVGPTGYECVIHSIYASNKDPVNTITLNVLVEMNKNGAGTFYAAKNITVPANTSLIFDKPITLRHTDRLLVSASQLDSCDVVASYLITAEDAAAPN
jgi:hypothetical protein